MFDVGVSGEAEADADETDREGAALAGLVGNGEVGFEIVVVGGAGEGGLAEIVEFELYGDGIGTGEGAGGVVGDQFGVEFSDPFGKFDVGFDIFGVGPLDAETFAYAFGFNGAVVDSPAHLEKDGPVFAVAFEQIGEGKAAQVGGGFDSEGFQGFSHPRADAPKFANREGSDKGVDLIGENFELPVGLVPGTGDLGDEFVWADPGGGGESEFAADGGTDRVGDLGGGLGSVGDIEIGLVEGEGFDLIGEAGKDSADFFGNGGVVVHPGMNHDEIRALFAGDEDGHGTADPEFAGTVVTGADDAAGTVTADRNRFVAETGVITHFDRRVKAILIDMDDFTGGHQGAGVPPAGWRGGC